MSHWVFVARVLIVVRTSRCGCDNSGSTPGEDILSTRHPNVILARPAGSACPSPGLCRPSGSCSASGSSSNLHTLLLPVSQLNIIWFLFYHTVALLDLLFPARQHIGKIAVKPNASRHLCDPTWIGCWQPASGSFPQRVDGSVVSCCQ